MNQFDKTTEQKAEKHADDYCGKRDAQMNQLGVLMRNAAQKDFTAGRNSAKESLEILARALEYYNQKPWDFGLIARQAIAAVKAHGNWPLDKPAESQGGAEGCE